MGSAHVTDGRNELTAITKRVPSSNPTGWSRASSRWTRSCQAGIFIAGAAGRFGNPQEHGDNAKDGLRMTPFLSLVLGYCILSEKVLSTLMIGLVQAVGEFLVQMRRVYR